MRFIFKSKMKINLNLVNHCVNIKSLATRICIFTIFTFFYEPIIEDKECAKNYVGDCVTINKDSRFVVQLKSSLKGYLQKGDGACASPLAESIRLESN